MLLKGYRQLHATFRVECFHLLFSATHLKYQHHNSDHSICFYWLLTVCFCYSVLPENSLQFPRYDILSWTASVFSMSNHDQSSVNMNSIALPQQPDICLSKLKINCNNWIWITRTEFELWGLQFFNAIIQVKQYKFKYCDSNLVLNTIIQVEQFKFK